MAHTKINTQVIPDGTIVSADLTMPITGFSSTGIDDNATSTAITIDASENVGIGYDSPSAKLHVFDDNAPCRMTVQGLGAGNSAGINILGRNSSNTSAPWTIQTEEDLSLSVGTGGSEAMRIDASGNVNVGDTTWYAAAASRRHLHVKGGTNGSFLALSTSGSGDAYLESDNGGRFNVWNRANGDMVFGTNNAERMRINAAGNVGIGSSDTNNRKLSVTGTGDLMEIRSTNSGAGGAQLDLIHNSPSPADGDSVGLVNFSNATAQMANITGKAASVGSNHGELHFGTRNGGAYNASAMVLDNSGNLLVGTTGTIGTGVEGVQIAPNLIITGRNQTSDQTHHVFKNPNGTVGRIRTLNNATDYVTSSDERLKENIVDAPAGNIDAIRVRSFDWKSDGSHETYGMVAQELVDVAPEAVSQGETEDDMWGVDYSKLVPMMIKEIQDLKAEVAALKGA